MDNKYVIRHFEEAPTYGVDNCADGVGTIKVTTILGDEPEMPVRGNPDDSESFHYVHIATLPVGTTIGEHPHEGNEQFYLVLEGKGEVTLCGDIHEVKPWSIAMIKSGASHGLKNTGDIPLKYICVEVGLVNG